jgi:hypothetical protein
LGRIYIHRVFETKEPNISKFIDTHLSTRVDPLVINLPLNPFSTHVQAWLSRNDPKYTPIFPSNQENLEEMDYFPVPPLHELSLDLTGEEVSDTTESPIINNVNLHPLSADHTFQPIVLDDTEEQGTINLELNTAIESIIPVAPIDDEQPSTSGLPVAPVYEPQPSTSTADGPHYEPAESYSDTSSDLESFSELIKGPAFVPLVTPSPREFITVENDQEEPLEDSSQALLDLFNEGITYTPRVNLNINRTPPPVVQDISENENVDNTLPDLDPLSPIPPYLTDIGRPRLSDITQQLNWLHSVYYR